MRKKISLLLLALICVLSFVGCASQESAEQDVTSLTEMSSNLVGIFSSMSEDDMEMYLETYEFDLDVLMYSNAIPADADMFTEMLSVWKTSEADCGEFVQLNEGFDVEVAGDEVTFTASATYTERNADIIFIYEDGRITSLTIDPVYSFNEIITKAILNTVLGMGTVFAVLIFIAFIISLFKYIPMIEEKFNKKAPTAEVVAPVVMAPVVEAVNVNADLELIAVITAAIAASEGTTTDGFVVRSIKRKKSNKWNA